MSNRVLGDDIDRSVLLVCQAPLRVYRGVWVLTWRSTATLGVEPPESTFISARTHLAEVIRDDKVLALEDFFVRTRNMAGLQYRTACLDPAVQVSNYAKNQLDLVVRNLNNSQLVLYDVTRLKNKLWDMATRCS